MNNEKHECTCSGEGLGHTRQCARFHESMMESNPHEPVYEEISYDHAQTLWCLARMITADDWIKELRKSIYAKAR